MFLKHKVKKTRHGYGRDKHEEYEEEEWSIKRIIIFTVLMVILSINALIIVTSFRTVPSGYVGVRLQWGRIIGTAGEGLFWCNPYLGEDIALVNVQIQAYNSEPQSTGTVDLQEVTTEVTVNYRIDGAFAMELYRDFRDQYEGRIVRPQLEDAMKSTTAQFTSTEMIQLRPSVRSTLYNDLKDRLEPYHITVVEVAMTEFTFSPEFNAQLEATATAQKKVLEEQANLQIIQLQQQQKVITATAEANATITKATADAQAQLIRAEAESKAIELLQKQLATNPEYLRYLAILQWDGKLPYFYGSEALLPFLYLEPTQP